MLRHVEDVPYRPITRRCHIACRHYSATDQLRSSLLILVLLLVFAAIIFFVGLFVRIFLGFQLVYLVHNHLFSQT